MRSQISLLIASVRCAERTESSARQLKRQEPSARDCWREQASSPKRTDRESDSRSEPGANPNALPVLPLSLLRMREHTTRGNAHKLEGQLALNCESCASSCAQQTSRKLRERVHHFVQPLVRDAHVHTRALCDMTCASAKLLDLFDVTNGD